MNTHLTKSSTAPLELKREKQSWLEAITHPAAPVIAAALACSDNALTAGTFTEPSDRLGYVCIIFTNTNVTGGRAIQKAPVTFINQNTAITSAHIFSDGILAKDPKLTVVTGTNFTTPNGSQHNVAVTNITIVSGAAILKLDTPVEKSLPIRVAASRPAARSFVFIAGEKMSGTPGNDRLSSESSTSWKKSVVTGPPRFGEAPQLYFNAEFSRDPYSDISSEAACIEGTSVFNDRGELVGLVTTAKTYSFQVSLSIFDLTNPDAPLKKHFHGTEASN
jgi:hypothetical protein